MTRTTVGLAIAVLATLTSIVQAASQPFPNWKVWTQPDANGVMTPHYAISLDGKTFSEARATSYDLTLRYGQFDPLGAAAQAPVVDETLAASPDASLHIVQFHTQPLEPFREVLRALGADVHIYLAHHSHIVRMNPAVRTVVETLPFVRWVGPYHPAYKLDRQILAALTGDKGDVITGHYSVQVFERGLAQQDVVADRIAALGGAVTNKASDGFRMTVTLTLAQVREVAQMDQVHFIDPWGPGEHDMDIVRQIGGAVPTLSGAGFTGQGVRAEVFDSEVSANHPEWNGQVPLYNGPDGDAGTHGSSVYGICFSTGVAQSQATGLLPAREQGIFNYYPNSTQFGGPTTRLTQNTLATNPAGAFRSVFQTSSIGSPRTTEYTTISAETDDYLFQVDYLSCQSMSNANLVPQTRPQAWAKNIVSVGGVQHLNTLTRSDDSSAGSTGPAADGRIKPDLAHFYDSTFTTTSGTGYTQFGGTSGATPCTCGHFGLFFQMWHEQVFAGFGGGASVFDSRCKSTTAKALLVNTAFRYDWNSGGSNGNMTRVRQGWGMADLEELYNYRNQILIVDETDVLTNLGSTSYNINIGAGEPVLRVTMVYLDPAGNPASNVHRVNDLDLRVTSPSSTVYWGNSGLSSDNFSTSGGTSNTLDTVENVFIQNPAAGTWTVEVIAAEINQDAHLETPAVDADYALVVTGIQSGPPTGACCVATTCTVETEPDCMTLVGVYQGDGTTCAGNPCAPPTGACCVETACSIETEPDCMTLVGVYQGDGTTCAGNPCGGDVVNLATADLNTVHGSISSGSFIDTHTSDNVYEAITESVTSGNPARRRSRLDHTWTFNVASGQSYVFSVEAYHSPNTEGDDFYLSYSLDNSSFTPMLTVTKTADDDGLQSYGFFEDIAGVVYVRVEDADRSQGNRQADTLFVDYMEILSVASGGDVTPPWAPTGLVATPGDATIGLDWADNGEPDLDGYNVYRATTSGGPYGQVNVGLVTPSDFTDSGVTNGTTYFYVVTAVDLTGNESANSDEVVATPTAGGGATTMHVSSIVASIQNAGGGNKRGRADVTIVDDLGAPVDGATVTVTFTAPYNDTAMATTNASGVAVVVTAGTARGGITFQACVDDVTHSTLSYNPAANVVTCDVR